MKKFTLLLFLFPIVSNAQIVITETDFATGGDTALYSVSSQTDLDFLATGNDYNWNFSALVSDTQKIHTYRPNTGLSMLSNLVFGGFAPVPYRSTYFMESTDLPIDQLTATLPITITDIFQYSKMNADSVTSLGYSMVVNGTEIPFKSDTIEKRYEFPIEFGNTTSSRGYTNADLNPIYNAMWRQYRQHNSTVDGWGSITTPYGTFSALRIKHEISEIDSIYISISGFATWLPLNVPPVTQYEWWTNNQKEPILRINTVTTVGNENITAVEYRDFDKSSHVGIIQQSSNEFKIFPNPVENKLSIQSNEIVKSIRITDISGKEIKKINILANKQVEINTTDLKPGTYFVELISADHVSKKSFVKR